MHTPDDHHHKHTYYLIKNGELRGFEPDEIEAIFRARSRDITGERRPAGWHDGYANLGRTGRKAVRTLSAILRLC